MNLYDIYVYTSINYIPPQTKQISHVLYVYINICNNVFNATHYIYRKQFLPLVLLKPPLLKSITIGSVLNGTIKYCLTLIVNQWRINMDMDMKQIIVESGVDQTEMNGKKREIFERKSRGPVC